jgi:hypothetical protein
MGDSLFAVRYGYFPMMDGYKNRYLIKNLPRKVIGLARISKGI